MPSRALLILDGPRPPELNMAIDEAMARYTARTGIVIIRIYQWSPPALSLGRSQPIEEARHATAEALGYRVVRRPTGGRAIVHMEQDLTYSATAPQGTPLHELPVNQAAALAAGAVARALGRAGIPAETPGPRPYKPSGPICLLAEGSADILVRSYKVSGAALARTPRSTLMHGTILVRHSPATWLALLRHTPGEAEKFQAQVAGLEKASSLDPGEAWKLAPLIAEELAHALDARPRRSGMPWELALEAERLHREKYTRPEWLLHGAA